MPRAKRQAWANLPPVPCASIAPGRVHFYDMPAHWYAGNRAGGGRPAEGRPTKEIDRERAARRSRRQAMEAAGWLWLKSGASWVRTRTDDEVYFRQAFWTLTVPEPMPEQDAREALSSWWTWARNVADVRSYLWAAELTKRGRVHFHALVNQWIDLPAASDAWLRALHRKGVGTKYLRAPAALCEVEAVRSAGKARGYVTKYVGKDFGTRKSQLIERYVRGHRGEDGYQSEHRPEIRARLVDVIDRPSIGKRRWGATEDLERRPIQLIGPEEPHAFKSILKELQGLPSTRWGADGDNGRPCYYSLDEISYQGTPALWSVLHQ